MQGKRVVEAQDARVDDGIAGEGVGRRKHHGARSDLGQPAEAADHARVGRVGTVATRRECHADSVDAGECKRACAIQSADRRIPDSYSKAEAVIHVDICRAVLQGERVVELHDARIDRGRAGEGIGDPEHHGAWAGFGQGTCHEGACLIDESA